MSLELPSIDDEPDLQNSDHKNPSPALAEQQAPASVRPSSIAPVLPVPVADGLVVLGATAVFPLEAATTPLLIATVGVSALAGLSAHRPPGRLSAQLCLSLSVWGVLAILLAVLARVLQPFDRGFHQWAHAWAALATVKFRSMRHQPAAEGQVPQATRSDPRVSRVGAFLRRTSLDELPQIFNVLRGELSLVGPRPHAVVHHYAYQSLIEGYLGRHRMRPGITGWAQVNGFRGETDTVEKMRTRVLYDLDYIENWSFWLDIRILAMSVFLVLYDQHAN
jgi:lipopolysaccharide/colanic/teichoic acid biosynthesis glycosyltransferase